MCLGKLSLRDFHQSLKEVLKVHIRLVAIDGAENQIQALFHLFVRCIHGRWRHIIVIVRLVALSRSTRLTAVYPCVPHDFVVFLRLDGIDCHSVTDECVRVEHASEHFLGVDDLLCHRICGFLLIDIR